MRVALPIPLLLMLAAQPVSAQPLRVFLEFESGDCVDANELEDAVESRLSRRVFDDEEDADLWIIGEADASGAALNLMTPDAVDLGSREIAASSCEELRESLVLILALIVDSTATRDAVERARPTWAGRVEALAQITIGQFPDLGIGVGASLDLLAPSPVGIRFELSGWLPTDTGSAPSVRFWALTAAALLCPRLLRRPRAEIALCAGVEAGVLHAEGRNVALPETSIRPTATALMRLRLAFQAGPLVFGLGFGGGATLVRDRYYVRQTTEMREFFYRADRFQGRVDVSLGVPF